MCRGKFGRFILFFALQVGLALIHIEQAHGNPPNLNSIYDRVVGQGVPARLVQKGFSFFEQNAERIENQRYMTLVDLSQHSTARRKYLISLSDGTVTKLLVAHGRNSDPNHDGYVDRFSNLPGSNQSSFGFYLTGERYQGKHGLSMRLNGLERSNSNARERAIVVHGAEYVNPNRNPIGRSFGCPAIEANRVSGYISRVENGSLYLIWHPLFNN